VSDSHSSHTRVPVIATSTRIAIHPAKAKPALAMALFAVFGAALLVAAAVADGTYFRIALAFVALIAIVTVFLVRSFAEAVRPGVIRVAADGPLRCVPPRSVFVWPMVLALVGTVPGIMFVLARLAGEEFGTGRRRSIALVVIAVVALGWLGMQVWALRQPAGLTISPRGLRGVRGAKSFDVEWEHVASAAAVEHRGRAQLELRFANSGPVSVPSPLLGSDPNVVAAIIEYFRMHAEQREALASSRTAILAVEAAVT